LEIVNDRLDLFGKREWAKITEIEAKRPPYEGEAEGLRRLTRKEFHEAFSFPSPQ